MRRALAEAATFALFAVLAVAMTWPLAARLDSAVPDHGDAYVSTLVMRWVAHALTSSAPLFDLPIFHPHRLALAFSEPLIGIALPLLPLYLAGADPLLVYNLGLLLGFALTGYGGAVLGRVATGSRAAGIAGGVFFAFLPYRLNHVAQISYVSAGWLALLLAAWLHWTKQPTRVRAALFGAAFLINGLACLHWLVLGGLALALATPVAIAMRRELRVPRVWLPLIAATAVSSAALAALLWPFVEVRRAHGMERTLGDTLRYSAQLRDWLVPPFHTAYAALLNDGSTDPERWLLPGFVPLLLVLASIACRRVRPSAIGLLIVAGASLTLAAFRSLAVVPLRLELVSRAIDFSGSALPPLAAGMACAIAAIFVGWRAASRPLPSLPPVTAGVWIVAGVLLAAGPANPFFRLVFRFIAPLRGIRVPARWSMIVFAAMAILIAAFVSRFRHRAAAAAICSALLLAEQWSPNRFVSAASVSPTTRWLASAKFHGGVFEQPFRTNGSEYRYMLAAATHLKPILGGVSSFEPADRDLLANADLDTLKKMGAAIVIRHGGGLCQDEVLALSSVDAPPLRCDAPRVTVISPAANADVRGPLELRVSGGRRVRAILGGLIEVPLTNGVAVVRERPRSLPRDTDVQFEVDGHRLEGTFLTWRRATELRWYDWRSPATWEIARRLGAPDALGREILTSRDPATVLVRATLRGGRGLDDAAFPDFASGALVGHRIAAGGASREEIVRNILESDEFARANLRP